MGKAVQIDHLSVYYGDTPAIKDVCLEVAQGEFLGIIGPNGGGKSTLLKAILGLIPANTGTIRIFSDGPLGYVPQFATMDKRFPISALEVVLTARQKPGLSLFKGYSKEDRTMALMQMEKVGIQNLAKRQIAGLSGGEFQRLLIARALALEPKILLLDEPTASVDAGSRTQIYNLLEELNKDMTIILVSHDLLAVSSKVQKLACMNGELVYHGEPELSEGVVNKLYGCPVELIAHGVPHRVLKDHEGGMHKC
ncbi:metal ABC transporter ATP-binding protein [Parasporobacterium paucivorans]|uniref:Zinc transport system ATP-binding protein n=1 Tax=Parasporobacterium paucivorans DSM 15970 TaxID=1122934 RepID=A0A1M6L8T9_9FIRM|nr:ABC transporter ATP-binding protein [Parasporobacterium paucivorans]SHJ67554.1 zinc transport system ATP-binding protein [Parasporobacterium paucivorans DSM 15970]